MILMLPTKSLTLSYHSTTYTDTPCVELGPERYNIAKHAYFVTEPLLAASLVASSQMREAHNSSESAVYTSLA